MGGRFLIEFSCWAVLRYAMCVSHARTIEWKYIVPMINTTSMIKLQLVLDRYINHHESRLENLSLEFKTLYITTHHNSLYISIPSGKINEPFVFLSFFHPFFLYIIILSLLNKSKMLLWQGKCQVINNLKSN